MLLVLLLCACARGANLGTGHVYAEHTLGEIPRSAEVLDTHFRIGLDALQEAVQNYSARVRVTLPQHNQHNEPLHPDPPVFHPMNGTLTQYTIRRPGNDMKQIYWTIDDESFGSIEKQEHLYGILPTGEYPNEWNRKQLPHNIDPKCTQMQTMLGNIYYAEPFGEVCVTSACFKQVYDDVWTKKREPEGGRCDADDDDGCGKPVARWSRQLKSRWRVKSDYLKENITNPKFVIKVYASNVAGGFPYRQTIPDANPTFRWISTDVPMHCYLEYNENDDLDDLRNKRLIDDCKDYMLYLQEDSIVPNTNQKLKNSGGFYGWFVMYAGLEPDFTTGHVGASGLSLYNTNYGATIEWDDIDFKRPTPDQQKFLGYTDEDIIVTSKKHVCPDILNHYWNYYMRNRVIYNTYNPKYRSTYKKRLGNFAWNTVGSTYKNAITCGNSRSWYFNKRLFNLQYSVYETWRHPDRYESGPCHLLVRPPDATRFWSEAREMLNFYNYTKKANKLTGLAKLSAPKPPARKRRCWFMCSIDGVKTEYVENTLNRLTGSIHAVAQQTENTLNSLGQDLAALQKTQEAMLADTMANEDALHEALTEVIRRNRNDTQRLFDLTNEHKWAAMNASATMSYRSMNMSRALVETLVARIQSVAGTSSFSSDVFGLVSPYLLLPPLVRAQQHRRGLEPWFMSECMRITNGTPTVQCDRMGVRVEYTHIPDSNTKETAWFVEGTMHTVWWRPALGRVPVSRLDRVATLDRHAESKFHLHLPTDQLPASMYIARGASLEMMRNPRIRAYLPSLQLGQAREVDPIDIQDDDNLDVSLALRGFRRVVLDTTGEHRLHVFVPTYTPAIDMRRPLPPEDTTLPIVTTIDCTHYVFYCPGCTYKNYTVKENDDSLTAYDPKESHFIIPLGPNQEAILIDSRKAQRTLTCRIDRNVLETVVMTRQYNMIAKSIRAAHTVTESTQNVVLMRDAGIDDVALMDNITASFEGARESLDSMQDNIDNATRLNKELEALIDAIDSRIRLKNNQHRGVDCDSTVGWLSGGSALCHLKDWGVFLVAPLIMLFSLCILVCCIAFCVWAWRGGRKPTETQ